MPSTPNIKPAHRHVDVPPAHQPIHTTAASAGHATPGHPVIPSHPAPPGPATRHSAETLPNPRHAQRIPAHISSAQLHRIRQAAHTLPQIEKPGDYLAHGSTGFEEHLDKLGHVLLQKPVANQRPSRWISPELMESALAHLAAVGTGPSSRTQMLERTSALEALGVSRRAGVWTRLVSHALRLDEPGWRVPVLFRVPVDASAVWAFYRTGDKDALLAALGPPTAYPHASELTEHLDDLVDRSWHHKPNHLDSLLPRLQAECAQPQASATLDEFKAACNRAQERWEHQATELDALEGLTTELAFQGYPDSFAIARRLNRKITIFIGPPNSGKTYTAFERLAQAAAMPEGQGAYLAPLRLLALEGRDRLVARGVPCSLLTGEENVPAEGARVVSSTIEMVGTGKPIEVAVIDEAQMIFDASRGWAWTQAIVAVPAKEVIIICSA
ncbi:MAG: hypothetical protein RL375_817, partial [Pseudomonadota bacterium]